MRIVILCMITTTLLWSTEYLVKKPIKVSTSAEGLMHYEIAEVYQDNHPMFTPEKILPITQFHNTQVLTSFPKELYKENSADSSLMLLLHAPLWNVAQKTPILLIHGAGDDAFRAWVHPTTAKTPDVVSENEQGFMQQLVKKGYPVFAINFSHNHGCNYLQAEHIRNAIQVIKEKTKKAKVHLIAHSKGNCAASIYLADGKINEEFSDFISPFADDVDTYIQLGAANKGIDLVFRYYGGNLYSIMNNTSSPVCFYEALVYGLWKDFRKQDIYVKNPGAKNEGNYFPGQNQLLYNLVNDGLDFSPFSYTPVDFNLTMRACYYGGTTAFVSSYGINYAVQEGGDTIENINNRGLAPSVNIINVYGTNSVIQEVDLGVIKIPIGVSDYPSDGMLYVHSASYIAGITSRGARLIGQRGFDKNHLRIAYDPEVLNWIDSLLWE